MKYALQFVLLVAWLCLTGLKVKHFLSEPTAFRSHLDHMFKFPSITIVPINPMLKRIIRIIKEGSEEERSELFANQTLLEFVRSHSLTLAEVAGYGSTIDEKQRREGNETTLEDYQGTWKLNVYRNIHITVTLNPSRPRVLLTLPRKTNLLRGFGGEDLAQYLYPIVFHSEDYFWTYDLELHTYLRARNMSHHQHIKVTIEREVGLDLRRQPCVKDRAYFLAECQWKCFLERVNCSMGSNDSASGATSGKPLCTASDFSWYSKEVTEFWKGSEYALDAPVTKCKCRPPCVQDRISHTTLSDIIYSTNDSLNLFIRMSRVRRTRKMVMTFGLEDLLAYAGGYLGLLLGASVLSVCGVVQRLAGRMVRRVKRRRQSRRPARDEAGNGAERARSLFEDQSSKFEGSRLP